MSQSGPLSRCRQNHHFWTAFLLKESNFISFYCFLRVDSSGCCFTIPAKKPMLWAQKFPPSLSNNGHLSMASVKEAKMLIIVGNRRWRCAKISSLIGAGITVTMVTPPTALRHMVSPGSQSDSYPRWMQGTNFWGLRTADPTPLHPSLSEGSGECTRDTDVCDGSRSACKRAHSHLNSPTLNVMRSVVRTYGVMRAQLSPNPTAHNKIPSGPSPTSRSLENSVAHVLSSVLLLHGEKVGQTEQSKAPRGRT